MASDESTRLLQRAEREHAHCIRRWEELRRTNMSEFLLTTQHDVDAHLPGPIRRLEDVNAPDK